METKPQIATSHTATPNTNINNSNVLNVDSSNNTVHVAPSNNQIETMPYLRDRPPNWDHRANSSYYSEAPVNKPKVSPFFATEPEEPLKRKESSKNISYINYGNKQVDESDDFDNEEPSAPSPFITAKQKLV